MKIELLELKIENFKGISEFNLELNGNSVWIKGENGTGKTTVADAFFWLFSNSNTEQRSNFNIIPLDKIGNAINFINPTVEAIITADGKTVKLKKIYKQVWSKRRGSEQEELTKHTTEHFFDDVPVSKSNYESRLNEIVRDDLFRAVADVKYFCGSTTPQYRRNVLLDVTGAITDDDIIDAYPELEELPGILNGRSIDDYRTVLNRDRRAINKKLDQLPASIKERLHGRPDIDQLNESGLKSTLDEINQSIDTCRTKIAELGTGVDEARLRSDLIKAEAELEGLERRIRARHSGKHQELADRKGKILIEISRKAHDLNLTIDTARDIEAEMEVNAKKRDELMKKWDIEDLKKFEPKKVCFACGQPIPDGMIRTQKDEFKKAQDRILSEIEDEGEALHEKFQSLQKKHKTELEHAEFINTQIEQLNNEVESINRKMDTIDKYVSVEVKKETEKLSYKVSAISEDLKKMDDDIAPKRKSLEDAILLYEDSKKAVKSDLDKIARANEIDRRVKELEDEVRAQGKALDRNAYEVGLMDKFLRYRAEYIEKTVNDHFTITDWKLFEELIGGGYKDICEPIYKGIPFNTDLNTGARINVGLDVIATLSRHYNIVCPIFIDNAESITGWIPTDTQIIRLMAQPGSELIADRGNLNAD